MVYYDGQQNDARMNVMLILSAVREGAATSNYVKVILQQESRRNDIHICVSSLSLIVSDYLLIMPIKSGFFNLNLNSNSEPLSPYLDTQSLSILIPHV